MIVYPDGTYEINFRYPDTNWYGWDELPDVYVVDETTPEGTELADKIMNLYPAYDLVIEDGELIDVIFNQDKQDEEDDHQDIIDNDPEIEEITLEDLGLDQVDNTSDMDKPISTATQEALDGKVDNERVLTDVPEGALFTDTITTVNGNTGAITKEDIEALGVVGSDHSEELSGIQDELARLETDKVDKVEGKGLSTRDFLPEHELKLEGIEPEANKYTHPESHPVEMIEGLATVATSGDYEDLINKPDLENIGGGGPGDYNFLIGKDEPALGFLEEGMMYFHVESEEFIEKISPSRVTISPVEPVLENLEEGELYFYYQV